MKQMLQENLCDNITVILSVYIQVFSVSAQQTESVWTRFFMAADALLGSWHPAPSRDETALLASHQRGD